MHLENFWMIPAVSIIFLIEKLPAGTCYIFLTVFSILTGVYMLFQSFGMGLLLMIGLPLLIRLTL